MSAISRAAALFGITERAATTDAAGPTPTQDGMPSKLQPPARNDLRTVTRERALTLSTVFRAVQIHATAVSQLPLKVERQGQIIPTTPSIVLKPSLKISRSRFFEELTVCMYLDGNAFIKIIRVKGEPVDIDVLDPRKVTVRSDPRTGVKLYGYGDRQDYTTEDIKHLKFLSVPGLDRGLGPIQAAQAELSGALDARDYGTGWFTEGSMPSGILKSDLPLTKDQADAWRNEWDGIEVNPETKERTRKPDAGGHRTRVLGAGISYLPMLLKPSDVQFLESQEFSTTQIARLMGVPSSLFLAAVQGGSQTYSNVEQDWIGYVRFSLMNVLREIEEVFTEITPNGQTARFAIDVLLRTDTKTRYEAHNLALTGGWKTPDEVREDEGLAPLTDAQRAQIKTAKPAPAVPAPASEGTAS